MKAKLTVSIDADLLPSAKVAARRRGVSLSGYIEDALRTLSSDGKQSFVEKWRGRFRPVERDEERYRRPAKKYPRRCCSTSW